LQAFIIIKRVIKGSDFHCRASSEILTGEDPSPPTNYASQKQTHALSQANTQGTQGEHVKTVNVGGKKIFDYSNRIKSTVKMRDISGNGSRFMLLHDENDDDVVENIMVDETGATSSHHSHNASPNVHGSDLDTTQRVADTQGMTDHMTTLRVVFVKHLLYYYYCYYYFMDLLEDVSILSWNIRGALGKETRCQVHDIINSYILLWCFYMKLMVFMPKWKECGFL
jgi:hypothetical protein